MFRDSSRLARDRRVLRDLRGCAVAAILLTARLASAQSITVTTAAVSIPSELAPAVAQTLATDVVTVTTGTAKLEFWWVKSLPLREGATGAPSWADVPDGSLVGAMRLGASWSDIRGFTVRPGVYTLRFALQPQNGDHLGISAHREFLLPAPAADDLVPAPVGYDGAVDLARKASRRAHPASISIDPPGSSGRPLSSATNDLGHQVVIVGVPASTGTITFGVVVEGTIDQ